MNRESEATRKLYGLDDKITTYLSGLPQAWSGVTVRVRVASMLPPLRFTTGVPGSRRE